MRTLVGKWAGVGLALMLGLHALSTDVFASAVGVPEISPASLSAGIALFAGGILVLRSRRRSK
jgi:hypothetical protein